MNKKNKNGQFKKGHIPYNKGLTRGSVSPKTEFKPNIHAHNFKGYGTPKIKINPFKRPEIYTTTKEKIKAISRGKEYNTRKRTTMARYLWTKIYGKIPKGMIVYNTNQSNPLNIEIQNLKLITRGELMKLNSAKKKIKK